MVERDGRGAGSVGYTSGDNQWEEHSRLVRRLSKEFSGLVVDINALSEQVRFHAETSGVAGIANMVAYLDFVDRCKSREGGELGRDLVLIFADVCDFKHLNDNFGHDLGDVAIKEVADGLSRALDSAKMARGVSAGKCFHLSGDEFLIVVRKDCVAECETTLRREFENRSIVVSLKEGPTRPGGETGPVRVSLAFGKSAVEGDDFEAAKSVADLACQYQKFSSRDDFHIAGDDEVPTRFRQRKTARLRCRADGCFTSVVVTVVVQGGETVEEKVGKDARYLCPVCGTRIEFPTAG